MLKNLKNIFIVLSLFFSASAVQAQQTTVKLPAPDTTGGKPLMQTLSQRHSAREFSPRAIDNQTLSEILWSAWGISHDGKRTIPTSMNKQNLNVYVLKQDGTWLYDAKNNQLQPVNSQDFRPYLAQQDYVMDAPLTLVFTGSDPKNSPLHAGSAYQNVGLYCASKGLNNVVRAYFDHEKLKKALNLKGGEDVIVSQTIGWKK